MKLRDEVMAQLKGYQQPSVAKKLYDICDRLTEYVVRTENEQLKTRRYGRGGKTLQQLKKEVLTETADFTKYYQVDFNDGIAEGIEELGIDARREEVDGHDYVFIVDGVEYEIEFKLTYYSPNEISPKTGEKIKVNKASLATGNKTSSYGGAKTNWVWSTKMVLTDNQISDIGVILVDTNVVEGREDGSSAWSSSSGRKDSYSTLQLLNEEIDGIIGFRGIVKTARKLVHFIPLPVEEVYA